MKTLIYLTIILIISNYTISNNAACAASSYCNACASDSSTCSYCYSFGLGTVKQKVWDTQNTGTVCTGTMPTTWMVNGCKYYNSALTSNFVYPTATESNAVHPRCVVCDGKRILHYSTEATDETCTDHPPADMKTCLVISDCIQTICKTNATTSYTCAQCIYNKYPTTVSSTTGEVTTCGEPTTAIANCILYNVDTSSGSVVYVCLGCDTGYAADGTFASCIAHTGEEGCKQLQSDNVGCYLCWHAYYFSGSVCILSSFVKFLVGFVGFAALLVLQ